MTPRTLRSLSVAAVLAACGVLPAAASAQSSAAAPSVSSNWAGYAVSGSDSQAQNFSSASGTWVTPAATCTPGSPTYSAFWVGLGGLSADSQALEQTGSEADCTASGRTQYYAWYELVPAAPVTINLNVAAGDTVSASVTVVKHRVTIRFNDHTQGTSVTEHLHAPLIDLSSAEWIAEAPSDCDDAGNCTPTPLTDFGSVAFSGLSATSAGHTGTVSDPDWSDQAIELQGDSASGSRHHFAQAAASSTSATPSALSTAGDAFAVAFSQLTSDATTTPTSAGPGFDWQGNRTRQSA